MMLINVKMPKALKKRHGFKVAADEEPHSYVGEDDEDDDNPRHFGAASVALPCQQGCGDDVGRVEPQEIPGATFDAGGLR